MKLPILGASLIVLGTKRQDTVPVGTVVRVSNAFDDGSFTLDGYPGKYEWYSDFDFHDKTSIRAGDRVFAMLFMYDAAVLHIRQGSVYDVTYVYDRSVTKAEYTVFCISECEYMRETGRRCLLCTEGGRFKYDSRFVFYSPCGLDRSLPDLEDSTAKCLPDAQEVAKFFGLGKKE